MATDRGGKQEPYGSAANVVPSDTAELSFVSSGIYVGVTGNVVVTLHDSGQEVIFEAVPAGTILPVRAKKIRATSTGSPTYSTTATGLVALY